MPTGYTEIIERKDDLTFEEFVWRCARAFGALISMRDESPDADIPTSFEKDDHYEDRLRRAREELEAIRRMSLEQAAQAAEKFYQRQRASYEESQARYARLAEKYNRMLSKVEAWEPPTENHVDLKKFMLDQIRESIKHDCHTSEPPTKMTPEEYLKFELDSVLWDVNYYTEKSELARKNNRDQNEWISQLVKSIGKPPKMG